MNDLIKLDNIYDDKAEMSCLASFLIGDEQIRQKIVSIVRPESFFIPEHQIFAKSMFAAYQNGDAVDEVTILPMMKSAGIKESFEIISAALVAVPSAANGEYYAKLVRDHAARRWIVKRGYQLADAAANPANNPATVGQAFYEALGSMLGRLNGVQRPKPNEELSEHVEGISSGRLSVLGMAAMPILTKLSYATMPGSVVMLCGPAGDGKTFLILHWISNWIADGIKVSILFCEQNMAWHMMRFTAYMYGDPNMLNYEWIRANANVYNQRKSDIASEIEAVGGCVHLSTLSSMTLMDAADWITEQAKKSRVVIIDPVSSLDAPDNRWIADKSFIKRVKKTAEKYGSTIILVTHPAKNAGKNLKQTSDDMQGGAAYGNFTDCVLMFSKHHPPKRVVVNKYGMPSEETCNRIITCTKARNGMAGGMKFGADFSGLHWKEYGVIEKEVKNTGQ